MTIFKIKDSLKDDEGRIRYEVIKDWSFVHPLLSVLIVDGALAFLMYVSIILSGFVYVLKEGKMSRLSPFLDFRVVGAYGMIWGIFSTLTHPIGFLGFSAFMSIYRGGFYYTPSWP